MALLLLAGCLGETAAPPGTENATNPLVPAGAPLPPGFREGTQFPSPQEPCRHAIWQDAGIFSAVWQRDSGPGFSDHLVEPGLEYVAPRPGLPLASPVPAWPHAIHLLSFRGDGADFSLNLFSSTPGFDVVAADEQQARETALELWPKLTEPGASFDERVGAWRKSGSSNGVPVYRAAVNGSFRLPDDFNNSAFKSWDLRTAYLSAGKWTASLSIPIYRFKPEQGFLEASAGGDVQASIVSSPGLREAANALLEAHGVGPSAFTELVDFGEGSCGSRTIG